VIFPKDGFLIDALTWPEVALLVVVVTGVTIQYLPKDGSVHIPLK
jgi:hypothetical protein